MGRGPIYLVYRIANFTGSAFTDYDVPNELHYIGSVQAINGNHARDLMADQIGPDPALILRANTFEQHAYYPARRSS